MGDTVALMLDRIDGIDHIDRIEHIDHIDHMDLEVGAAIRWYPAGSRARSDKSQAVIQQRCPSPPDA